MFTGLIQALATIRVVDTDRLYLSVSSDTIIRDLMIGDSVAVDGVCLTVEEILPEGFVATASPVTLQRTTLGRRFKTETSVNPKTDLRVGSKIGGHFVSRHVVGYCCLVEFITLQNHLVKNYCESS